MNTNSKLNDMGADLIDNQSNIIDDLTAERDVLCIKMAHVKDLIYALGLDYNKLSERGKMKYDMIVKCVGEYGEK